MGLATDEGREEESSRRSRRKLDNAHPTRVSTAHERRTRDPRRDGAGRAGAPRRVAAARAGRRRDRAHRAAEPAAQRGDHAALRQGARAGALADAARRARFAACRSCSRTSTCYSAGDPYHCGMRFLRRSALGRRRDERIWSRSSAPPGFVFLGKTNTPELGLDVTTEPTSYGRPAIRGTPSIRPAARAAARRRRSPPRMVPAAHASDGGGSIRIPASECGLVGLKPSRGRVSLGPEHGEYWHGLVISHVVTRSVRDSAAILDAIAGAMPGDPYVAPPPARPYRRGGRSGAGRAAHRRADATSPGGVHASRLRRRRRARRRALLASLGHAVEAAASRGARRAARGVELHFMTVIVELDARPRSSTGSELTGKRRSSATTSSRRPGRSRRSGRASPPPRYIAAIEWLHGYTRRMASWWAAGFDLLLTPTLGEPPPRLGELARADRQPARHRARARAHPVHAAVQHHRPAGDLAAAALERGRAADRRAARRRVRPRGPALPRRRAARAGPALGGPPTAGLGLNRSSGRARRPAPKPPQRVIRHSRESGNPLRRGPPGCPLSRA